LPAQQWQRMPSTMWCALTRWVEDGVAPDQIIASEFVSAGSNPMAGPDAGTAVKSTRPVCAYPRVAQYKGRGSTSDAANFACAAQ
jgi:feruloyl esterase